MKMKAYAVSDDEHGIIVFHETPGKAKSFAYGAEDAFSFGEYTDLSVRRELKADKFVGKEPDVLLFCPNADFYHSIGWNCHSSGDCEEECVFKKEPFK
jgi:hypothetical protein